MAAPHVISAIWREPLDKPVLATQVVERAAGFARSGFGSVIATGGLSPHGPLEAPVPVHEARSASLWAFARLLRGLVREASAPSVIVARNSIAAVAALAARPRGRAGVVFDVRGWARAEARDAGRGHLTRAALRALEGAAYRRSDHTVVVSQGLVGVALAHGADPRSLTLIPHHVERGSGAARDDGPRAEVLHVGDSRQVYQSADRVEPLLRGLAAALPDTTFGWLDGAYAGESAEWLLPNLWRMRVPSDSIGAFLDSARVGLVIRPRDATNAVAVTTKATQYAAHGCSIVTTAFPPAVAEMCVVGGVGEVVLDEEPSAWERAVRRALAREARNPPPEAANTEELWSRVITAAARAGS